MSTDPQPWEVIRAAADRLEKRASAATSGPWAERAEYVLGNLAGEWGPWRVCEEATPEDRAWISTLSPAVAEPLVAWLRDAAEAAEEHKDDETAPVNMGKRLCSNELKALDLARVILEQP